MRTRTALPLVTALALALAGCGSHARPLSAPGSSSPVTRTASATPSHTATSSASAPRSSTSTPTSSASTSDPDPLSGVSLWVNPATPAADEVRKRTTAGQTADARTLQAIAGRPTAVWLGSWAALDEVSSVLSDADRSGSTPVFVAYFIPDRDCGGQSSGGADSDGKYRDWIGSIVRGRLLRIRANDVRHRKRQRRNNSSDRYRTNF